MRVLEKSRLTIVAIVAVFHLVGASQADLMLPSIFSEHMVLQRAARVPVWGKAAPGEEVSVTLAGQTVGGQAGSDGKWRVDLDLQESPAGPFEMVVRGRNTIRIGDVVVGEVWLGSGQSNMGHEMYKLTPYTEEVATAYEPLLREYVVIPNPSIVGPVDDCRGFWRVVKPGATGNFSAVGYTFMKSIREGIGSPVAFIFNNWGGVSIERYLSREAIAGRPELAVEAAKNQESTRASVEAIRSWLKATNREDRSVSDLGRYTTGPVSAARGWIEVGAKGESTDPDRPKYGAFWYRKEVQIPREQCGSTQRLLLAPTAMFDRIYWNGRLIGETNLENFLSPTAMRWHYLIPGELIREGSNDLAVRIFAPAIPPSLSGAGSVGGKPLPGPWQMKVEYALPPLESVTPPPATEFRNLGFGSLYNGMIHPIVPYAIRGALWYQGEANTGRAAAYRSLFPLMIEDWRRQWGQGDFPFYYCQLAGYREKNRTPMESQWAELREAQLLTLSVPNTGMAVLFDIGESEDIHPAQKDVAGKRLARMALARTYGQRVPYSGPIYDSMRVERGRIRISFKHVEGGLVAREVPTTYDVMRSTNTTAPLVRNSPNSQLEGFAICGADRKWAWADAKIDGDTVLVWSTTVPAPVAVRYAWADNPTANLYNQPGLPASPFRTDDFPMITAPGARSGPAR